mmetsp:Transcript_80546/g.130578  ORF Transcript_80546/g.130578 Transcript_80546/m.130578 type:complete len:741 (+) Transcript_80546:72-2294(+)
MAAMHVVLIMLALANLPFAAAHGGCIHDKVAIRKPHIGVQQYNSDRRGTEYEAIRIAFDFDGIDSDLPAAQQTYIKKLIADAGDWLQKSLKVQRVTTNLKWQVPAASQSADCGDVISVPSKYANPGVDADTLIFVLAQALNDKCASGQVLAYASYCQQDQNDRPVVGYIQMCPAKHDVKTTPGERDEDYHTALHEILHILGWSAPLFPYYRDSFGLPRTPRCAFDNEPAVDVYIDGVKSLSKSYKEGGAKAHAAAGESNEFCCAADTVGQPPFNCNFNGSAQIYFTNYVSPNVVEVQTVQTGLDTVSGLDRVSNTRTFIKTPQLLAQARKHFDCPDLVGVELEDDGGVGSAGSHWEKRQMMTEFMCAAPSGFKNRKSVLTLALLEDSGWYQVDYGMADVLRWGLNKGCTFANTCGPKTSSSWCQIQSKRQCSFDRSGIGNCSNTGRYMEGCPFVLPAYLCDNFNGKVSANQATCQGAGPCKGDTISNASGCFDSSLFRVGYGDTPASLDPVGCYEYACIATRSDSSAGETKPGAFKLQIKDPLGVWRTCSKPSESFSDIAGFTGALTCPDDWTILCATPSTFTSALSLDSPVDKATLHFVTLSIIMPYTVLQMDDASLLVRFKRAIASVVGTIVENIVISYPSSGTRRLLAQTLVEVKILAASAQRAVAIKSSLGLDPLAKVNAALKIEGLDEATSVTVTSSADGTPAPILSGTATNVLPLRWYSYVQVCALLLLVSKCW